MADFVDDANQSNEFHDNLALLRHANRHDKGRAADNLCKVSRGEAVECEECGDPIEPRRIEFVPDARHCAQCAGILEKKSKTYAR